MNHNGDFTLARRMIEAAAECGADAVKFQTFRAERVVRAGTGQLEMLRRLELSQEAHRELRSYCEECGLLFISTPFDKESVDLLDSLDVPAYKIASGDVTNWPLLEYIAKKGKPVILSTGMCYLSEVDGAFRILRSAGCEDIALLHCVSTYPTEPGDVNLRAMQTMAAAFQVPVGFSDHTSGIVVSLAAVALGGCIIERHFTLDRELPGPDQKLSLEPDQFARMVREIRIIEQALGTGQKVPTPSEMASRHSARRSLVAAREIPAGTLILEDMIDSRRPADGLPPSMQKWVVGRRTRVTISAGEYISWEQLQ